MVQISFDITGQKQLSRNLRVFATNMQNLDGFFSESLDIVEDRSKELFKKGGKNVEKNPSWKKLSKSTRRAREKRWGHYRKTPSGKTGILRWTGALQDNTKKETHKKYGVFYFKTPYAIHHQLGSKHLPKRVLIDLDNSTNAKIVKAMQKKINDELKIFGLQA